MGADLIIYKSWLNINANRTIFGGTIFSAIDPFYPVLLDQYFRQKGIRRTVAWLKTAHIDYIKPGRRNLHIQIRLDETMLTDALRHVRSEGKVVRTFRTEVFDTDGIRCAVAHNEIYIRDLDFPIPSVISRPYEVQHKKETHGF